MSDTRDTVPDDSCADPARDRAAAIRRFNRCVTRRIGVLHEGMLHSPFTLTQSRLLWELALREHVTAGELAHALDLDAGYLSRLLADFKARELITAERSKDDARQLQLRLAAAGRRAFAPLDARSRAGVAALLAPLAPTDQRCLLQSMAQIERILDGAPPAAMPVAHLRPHRPGDIGWVIERHGALYADEYGFDAGFEALVARIGADFLERFDAHREACWVAERDDAKVGSVMLVQARDDTTREPLDGVAQLRLLLIEPAARGQGLGARLVDACTAFARRVGYRRIVLWTQNDLTAARAIYRKAGYVLTSTEPHDSFGRSLVGERWELALA